MNYLLLIPLIFSLTPSCLHTMEPSSPDPSQELIQLINTEDEEAVRILLLEKSNIDVNVQDSDDAFTALMMAVEVAKPALLNLVLKHPSLNINHPNHTIVNYGNPLHYAIGFLNDNDAVRVVDALLKNETFDLNATNQKGWTPLMMAAYGSGDRPHSEGDLIGPLMPPQEDTEMDTERKNTGELDIGPTLVSMLLKRGADTFPRSTANWGSILAGSTAFKIACLRINERIGQGDGELSVVQLLTKYEDLQQAQADAGDEFKNIPQYLMKLMRKPGFMQFIKDNSKELFGLESDCELEEFFEPIEEDDSAEESDEDME